MRPGVFIIGTGCTVVGEHWEKSLCDLACEALLGALRNAENPKVDAIVVGNMLSGVLNRQENLGAVIADRLGLHGVESVKVEAACASAAAALRVGSALVSGGFCNRVAVVGVEKMSDAHPAVTSQAIGYAADFESETLLGSSFTALAALLTTLYLEFSGASTKDLSRFVLHAHSRAVETPWAMFQRGLTENVWHQSPVVSSPLRLHDCAPICDGAAAVILSSSSSEASSNGSVELLAVEGATDTVSLANRKNPMMLSAASTSIAKALNRAQISLHDVQIFEIHDAFPVIAALSLEAAALMPAGNGWRYFDQNFEPDRPRPAIQTMGGLKGRGHPIGATGLYQIVEGCTQLKGNAGANQVPNVSVVMTQSFGGLAANVYTSILRRNSDA